MWEGEQVRRREEQKIRRSESLKRLKRRNGETGKVIHGERVRIRKRWEAGMTEG
jgi:hypothetical protein